MKIEAIDHVHVEVDDRDEAAVWYAKVLGLSRSTPFEEWAASPMGPLFLATAEGMPALALFQRERKPVSRDNTVAFRISGRQLLEFADKAASLKLIATRTGKLIKGKEDIVDHTYSWSLYFQDPYDNKIELTTYEYEEVKSVLLDNT